MGPGDGAPDQAVRDAEEAARLVAGRGWVVLCGGRHAGVMAAAARGAHRAGGISIGLLPGSDQSAAAPHLTAALATGLGEARNAVLVSAAHAVVACGMSSGTAAEVALALREGKPTVLVQPDRDAETFFRAMASAAHPADRGAQVDALAVVATVGEAVEWIAGRLGRRE